MSFDRFRKALARTLNVVLGEGDGLLQDESDEARLK
jgi:hypothetical protein